MPDPNNYGMQIPKGKVVGCTTIDHTNTDNGFLDCVRSGFPQIASNHESTEIAVDNLLKCAQTKISVNIFGHGEDGRFATGTGQVITGINTHISMNNVGSWEPFFKSLKDRILNLYLFGCHPGAGDRGADLLFTLARIVNAPVVAPTGFIYCGPHHFRLEDNSTWQVASPGFKPSSIAAPKPSYSPNFMKYFIIYKNRKPLQVNKETVASIDIKTSIHFGSLIRLTDNQKNEFLTRIDLSQPIELPGIPGAIVSGSFIMTINNENEEIQKEYLILNRRLVQDKEHPLIAYNCDTSIMSFFG
jgi:hypothetical protein